MSRSTTRRGSDRRNRSAGAIAQPPFRQLTLQYAPIAVISDDEVEAIHAMGLTVLEEIGFSVLASEARALYRRAGAEVDEAAMQVRLDRELVAELVAKAPPSFTLAARNPERALRVGGRDLIFASVGGPAYVMDQSIAGGATGSYAEMCDYLRLVHVLNIIHQEGGGPFEPMDLPAAHPPSRYLLCRDHPHSTRTGSPRRFGRARTMRCLGDGSDLARPLARSRWSTCRCSPASSTPIRRCSSTCRWPRD